MFTRLGRTLVYQDAWLKFYQDQIRFPDGSEGTYAWADRMSGVGIVVVTPDNTVLLCKEYRYVIDAHSWEVPGGGIDVGESPMAGAQRELQEETGLMAPELEFLGEFYPLNSFNKEKVTVFLARLESQPVHTQGSEASEHVSEQRFVPFAEALKMIDSGEVIDALTANAVQMAIRRVSDA